METDDPIPAAGPPARRTVLVAAALALLTAVLFLPALQNGFVNWDDPELLLRNFHFRGFRPDQLGWMFSNALLGHYHPFTWISFALDHACWGMNPGGYHATNVLLHVVNTVLVFLLIRRLPVAGRPAGSAGPWFAAAVAAAFWAWHPLRVEAVAWATARRDVLSAMFQLATLLAWLRAVRTDPPTRRWKGVAVAFFVAALLSKGTAVMLPAVMLVLDVMPLRRRAAGEPAIAFARRMIVEKVPFLGLAGAFAVVAMSAASASGAMRPWTDLGPLDRIVQAAFAPAFYLAKALLPSGFSPLYRLPDHPAAIAWPFVAGFAATLAAGGTLFLLRRRLPSVAAACACALLLVAPVLGFLQSGPQAAADRYTYLPAVALAPLVAAALAGAWTIAVARVPVRLAGIVAGCALVLLTGLYAGRTRAQLAVWADGLTLWTHALGLDPASPVALNNRGHAREDAADIAGAMADYNEAVRVAPRSAQARLSRGTLLAQLDRGTEAADEFGAALELNPGSPEGHNGMGNLLRADGHRDTALRAYSRAIELRPDYADALYNRGTLRAETGDAAGARADFDAAIRLAPDNARAWHNRGILRHKQGDVQGAVQDYQQALVLDPSLEEGYRKAGLIGPPTAGVMPSP